MSDENKIDLDVLNDLDIDTSTVDTSRPYLPKGKYECSIKEVSVLPSKTPGNKNLRVDFALKEPTEAENGTLVNAGFMFSRFFPLQPSAKSTTWDFRVDIVKLLEAVYGEKVPFNSETIGGMVGRDVIVKLKVTESDEYGTGNEVAGFEKA